MRIPDDRLQEIYDEMSPTGWKELGRLHVRQPLGLKINGWARPKLVHLGLAEPIGRQNLEHAITALGVVIWEQHRPPVYHRRQD